MWVIGDLRDNINDVINDADNTPVRYRYWKLDNRKLWVLDCVACTMPITAGVVVEDGKILDISVLSYRESRGHEVQSRAHRAQYFGATITPKKKIRPSDQWNFRLYPIREFNEKNGSHCTSIA